MAKLKYEFLDHYHRANGLPLRNRMFAGIERINRVGSRLAPLANWLARTHVNRWLMETFTGIDRRRPLPQFAGETFEDWFRKRTPAGDGAKGEIVLFHDTFNNFNTPQVAVAAARFFEHFNYRVVLVDRKCCGRPMISKGMLGQAKENALYNVERLASFAQRGTPIVGLEPSCLLTFRDEYPEFLGSEAARSVANDSFLFEEFVTREEKAGRIKLESHHRRRKVLLHGHCHQKALVGTAPTIAMSAIKASEADVEIVAPGISCRQQIEHLTHRKAKHPTELLWESCG
jgi:Fe-S oxidoreductase